MSDMQKEKVAAKTAATGKGRVLMIGAGGVATVCAFKIVQNQDVFKELMIA
ncbi:MAG: saccharopine dehydrogenase family protein, partial [Hallella bergensis]